MKQGHSLSEREAIRQYVAKTLGVKIRERKIRAIQVNARYRWQPPLRIEVGHSYSNLEPDAPMEEVVAIFESTVFCVCTSNRGTERGMPYLFNRDDITSVEEY